MLWRALTGRLCPGRQVIRPDMVDPFSGHGSRLAPKDIIALQVESGNGLGGGGGSEGVRRMGG